MGRVFKRTTALTAVLGLLLAYSAPLAAGGNSCCCHSGQPGVSQKAPAPPSIEAAGSCCCSMQRERTTGSAIPEFAQSDEGRSLSSSNSRFMASMDAPRFETGRTDHAPLQCASGCNSPPIFKSVCSYLC